ncbi:protein DESIGUAL 4 [Raphanus sativus]|uniref:Protein DESIGUAL 4 n=1 Tax=Raphanus sativus TaxID=3726 RepID=A0A9W3CRK8_RAPSA|nr:protein DESIGUAL 4 [Raphanus sativus]
MGKGGKGGKSGCFSVTIVLCILVIVGLDFVAGIVAKQAEVAQDEVKHVKLWILECKAPSQKAFMLGIIALGCLLVAHIIAIIIGCSISNMVKVLVVPKLSAYLNMACLSLTWIVAILGAGLLTLGIWMNRESRSKCGFTDKHILSYGSKVCFAHAAFSVVLYVTTIVSKKCPL